VLVPWRNSDQNFNFYGFSVSHGWFERPMAECDAGSFVHFRQETLKYAKVNNRSVLLYYASQNDHLVDLVWWDGQTAEVKHRCHIRRHECLFQMNDG